MWSVPWWLALWVAMVAGLFGAAIASGWRDRQRVGGEYRPRRRAEPLGHAVYVVRGKTRSGRELSALVEGVEGEDKLVIAARGLRLWFDEDVIDAPPAIIDRVVRLEARTGGRR